MKDPHTCRNRQGAGFVVLRGNVEFLMKLTLRARPFCWGDDTMSTKQSRRVRLMLALVAFAASHASAQHEWVLQPWVEVFGKVNNRELGKSLARLTPRPSFPYRLAVSEAGKTGLYRLQSATDTSVQIYLIGGELLPGDLDGDGIEDYAVRTPEDSIANDSVYVFKGTAGGIDSVTAFVMGSEARSGVLRPMVIGDLDGDGINDLILTDPFYGFVQGKVYIIWGPVQEDSPVTTLHGDSARYLLGYNAAIGDINDDGRNDLVVRGVLHAYTSTDCAYINIYWGNGSRDIDTVNRTQIRTGYYYTIGLACFDANGDGKDDLLWATLDTTAGVHVHFGRSNFNMAPDLRLDKPSGLGNFGEVIINAGDMNGDGYTDIAVSAPRATITSGFVFVYSGGPFLDGKFDAAKGQSTDSDFGRGLSSVGDATGDGLSDIAIGAWDYDFGTSKGYWGIFQGSVNIPVPVEETVSGTPESYVLHEPYPNPFNPLATIEFEVGTRSRVSLDLYDPLGRHVQSVFEGETSPGRYQIRIDGSSLPSGTYFCRINVMIESEEVFRQTVKLILIR
jgi:hypothetical protein